MSEDKNSNPFDEDDDDGEAKKKKAEPSDPHARSLRIKAGKGGNNVLYYVDYSKLRNNGNGLDPEERNELASNLAEAEAKFAVLADEEKKTTIFAEKLLGEPLNEEVDRMLASEEPALEELKNQVESSRALKVNEKTRAATKKRIGILTAEVRKRRKLCTDGLRRLEDMSEGAISYNACMKGKGQIDVESDEMAVSTARAAYEFKLKSRRLGTKVASGIVADPAFIGVILRSNGMIERVYASDKK